MELQGVELEIKEQYLLLKKQWIKIVFGIVLALGYGGLHVPPNVSVSEVIYAIGILFITLYVVFRALRYFKLI